MNSDNLEHFYFLKKTHRGIGLRYSLNQILYDLVTVPEHIRNACMLLRANGAPRSYTPSFYMVKHAARVIEQLPGLAFDDLIFICNYLGNTLSATVNKKAVEKVLIAVGDKVRTGTDIRKNRLIDNLNVRNDITENSFNIVIYYLPDYGSHEL